jgi:hypothetical protein
VAELEHLQLGGARAAGSEAAPAARRARLILPAALQRKVAASLGGSGEPEDYLKQGLAELRSCVATVDPAVS